MIKLKSIKIRLIKEQDCAKNWLINTLLRHKFKKKKKLFILVCLKGGVVKSKS